MQNRTSLPVIAIDGPTASGKGTLARKLADRLGFAFLDTGALYRLVAWRLMEAGRNPEDHARADEAALALGRAFTPADLEDPRLRRANISQPSSIVAAHPGVRTALVDIQRRFAANPPVLANGAPARGAVLDGRDIGTVICPDAALKIFVTARPDVRAQRRFNELHLKENSVTYDAVLEDIHRRDARDRDRETAPFHMAEDAHVLDTSDMDVDQALAAALSLALKAAGIAPSE